PGVQRAGPAVEGAQNRLQDVLPVRVPGHRLRNRAHPVFHDVRLLPAAVRRQTGKIAGMPIPLDAAHGFRRMADAMNSRCAPPPDARAIGIDCGGTNVKAALFAGDGTLLRSDSAPAWPADGAAPPPPDSPPPWAAAVRRLVDRLSAGTGVAATGLAAPGLAAPDGRSIASMPGRMQGIEGWDWSAFLGRPVPVLNDARAALLGEAWCGAARGRRDV